MNQLFIGFEIESFTFGEEIFKRSIEKTKYGKIGVFRSSESFDIFFDTEKDRDGYFDFLKLRDGNDIFGNHKEYAKLGIFDTSQEIESYFLGPFIYGIKSTKSKIEL